MEHLRGKDDRQDGGLLAKRSLGTVLLVMFGSRVSLSLSRWDTLVPVTSALKGRS